MTTFTGGDPLPPPLELSRAPLFLRVVRERASGAWDALDLLSDGPRTYEQLHAYRRVGPAGWIHIDYTERRTGRRKGRTIALAEYARVEPQPDDATMRDTAQWRAWCLAQVAGPTTQEEEIR